MYLVDPHQVVRQMYSVEALEIYQVQDHPFHLCPLLGNQNQGLSFPVEMVQVEGQPVQPYHLLAPQVQQLPLCLLNLNGKNRIIPKNYKKRYLFVH
jgi:hypothetical protein